MATTADYVLQIKVHLLVSSAVASFTVVEEKVWSDRGYIRIRCVLTNGDLLEVAEYFVREDDECRPERYRYQWMEGKTQRMRRRWDNVKHYPGLPNFPYHIHMDEETVVPGERLSIVQLLGFLEKELAQQEDQKPSETGKQVRWLWLSHSSASSSSHQRLLRS